jgi:UDP-3-O-[3-hydroxymyristoyl] glucosamine N-acyltransferase
MWARECLEFLQAPGPSISIKSCWGFEAGLTQIVRVVKPQDFIDQTLCFIKSQAFWQDWQKVTANASNPISGLVIIEEKIWNQTQPELQEQLKQRASSWIILTNVPLALAKLSKLFYDEKYSAIQSAVDGRQMGTVDIHPSALISQNVFIGEHVTIGEHVVIHPGCVIGPHVKLGARTEIFPHVSLLPFTHIGSGVRIFSQTCIGSDGFGYVFDKGEHHKIWHYGGVVIEDNVEIGANCSIDQGTFYPTKIGEGTKIDNQVQVAHNCQIGKGCILCGQAGMAGSSVLEDYVVLGGRVAIGPDAHLGKGTQVAGGAMVNESAKFPPGSTLGGHPAKDLKEWMRTIAWVRKNALQKNP